MEVHFQCTIQICRYQCPDQCASADAGYSAPQSPKEPDAYGAPQAPVGKNNRIRINRKMAGNSNLAFFSFQ